MAQPRDVVASEVRSLVAQGRIIDAVVDGGVVRGDAVGLAHRLGVEAADLIAAVDELRAVGWLVVEIDLEGVLTLRWSDEPHQSGAVRRVR